MRSSTSARASQSQRDATGGDARRQRTRFLSFSSTSPPLFSCLFPWALLFISLFPLLRVFSSPSRTSRQDSTATPLFPTLVRSRRASVCIEEIIVETYNSRLVCRRYSKRQTYLAKRRRGYVSSGEAIFQKEYRRCDKISPSFRLNATSPPEETTLSRVVSGNITHVPEITHGNAVGIMRIPWRKTRRVDQTG